MGPHTRTPSDAPGHPRPRAATLVSTCVLVLALHGCAQQYHEASWDSVISARQQDAIDRGWIPDFLPEDTTDVRQRNEPATGARIVLGHLPEDVAIPVCNGPSDTPVPLDAEWFPRDLGAPLACPDGWTLARGNAAVTLWHAGDAVPNPPTPSVVPTTPSTSGPSISTSDIAS